MPIITLKIPPMLNSHIRSRNAFIQGRAWLGMHVSKPKFGISFGEKFITLISTKWKKGAQWHIPPPGPPPLPGPSTMALYLGLTKEPKPPDPFPRSCAYRLELHSIYLYIRPCLTHRKKSYRYVYIRLIFLLFRFRGDPDQKMPSVSMACRKMLLNDAALRIRVVRPGKPRSRVISRFDTIKIPPCSMAISAASIGLNIFERDEK